MSTGRGGETFTAEEIPRQTIDDVELNDYELQPTIAFIIGTAIGIFFFLTPVKWEGVWTIPLDVVANFLINSFTGTVEAIALIVILGGAVVTTIVNYTEWDLFPEGTDLSYFDTSPLFWATRVIGALLAPLLYFSIGPSFLHTPGTGGVIWDLLMVTAVVIIPIGYTVINIFISYGGLEFIGTLSQPLMRPLFNLPGRSALDALTSWLASMTIGIIVTRKVFEDGGYNKKEAYILVTCFATGGIGLFVATMVAPLELLYLFPVIVPAYLFCIIVAAIITVRLPPLKNIPEEYITEPDPEPAFSGSLSDYLRLAYSEAIEQASKNKSVPAVVIEGFVDGVKIAATILGTILAIGMAALLFEAHTPVFDYLGLPLVPFFEILGFPNAELLGPASIVGITEILVPIFLVLEAEPMAKFFVALLSITQIIFFSTHAPMAMDLFEEIPIRARDLVVLFVIRSIILIPLIAAITLVVNWLGMF